ncbi:hypothetical protein KAH27_10855, partial [bacterium]|nr:hypothetical protein [bacterium]
MRKYLFWLSINLLTISMLPSQVVHQMDFDRFTVYRIADWVTYGPADQVTSIDIGQKYAYIGTRKGGILRYDLFNNKWKYPYTTGSGLRSNSIIRVVYDYERDRIYARTIRGVDVYNEAFNYWEPTYTEPPKRRKPTPVEIRDFHNRGGYDYPPFYRPTNSELPDFFTDRNYIYRLGGEILDRDNTIFQLTDRVTDQFRQIWVGTNGAGLGIGDLNTFNLTVSRRSIPDVILRDILFDGKNMWAAGIGKESNQSGIGLWNRKKDNWRYFRAGYNLDIYNDNIRVISSFNKRIYFGSEGGLLVFDKQKELWKTLTLHDGLQSIVINDLYEFEDKLFVATETGFNWIDRGTGVNSSHNRMLNGTEIFKIVSLDSLLLLTTNSGVYTFSPNTEEIKLFNIRASLPDN